MLNGVVYFSTFDELTYALDARTGKLLWTFRDGKYAGVVADARAPLSRRPRPRLWDGRAVRYVVTGAAGFIGSHLAEALLAAGHEVVGIDSLHRLLRPARVKERNASGLDVRAARSRRRDELDFAGWDGVFHLAGQPGVRSFGDVFPLYVERNVLASQRVFEAAAAAGVRVVFASSSSVYGEAERYPTPEETPPRPLSPYGITKLACEHLARASGASFGLDAVVLRYFNAYGPRQRPDMAFPRVVEALLEGRPFTLFGDGEQSRSFTYVGDVVAASMLAMERGRSRLGLQRRRRPGGDDERDDRAARAASPAAAWRSSGATAVAGDQRRTKADTTRIRRRPRLAAEHVARGGPAGAMGLGGGRVARVNRPEPVPDPDAEREVDLRSVWERIAARWWLPVLGLVLGLVIGFALALGGGKVYEAETLVAMGQPFSPERRRAGAEPS